MRVLRAILIVVSLLLLGTGEAKADTVVSGTGSWSSGLGDPSGLPAPPSTIYSAGGQMWSFSFTLPNPVTDAIDFGIGFQIPATDVSGLNYSLNGSPVSTPPVLDIAFFDSTDGGGFDIDFTDGQTVSLYGGVQMFGGSPTNMTFVDGTFSDTPIAMNDQDIPDGEGSGTVTIASTSVPEPTSLSLLGLGLFAAAAARKARSKRA